DELYGARARQRELTNDVLRSSRLFRDRIRGGERETGPQPFAAAKQGIPHRLVDERRSAGRKRMFESGLDEAAELGEGVVEWASAHARSVLVGIEQPGGLFQIAAFGEDFDAPLGRAQLIVAVARELDPALEERERFLERKIALLELLDDLLQLG